LHCLYSCSRLLLPETSVTTDFEFAIGAGRAGGFSGTERATSPASPHGEDPAALISQEETTLMKGSIPFYALLAVPGCYSNQDVAQVIDAGDPAAEGGGPGGLSSGAGPSAGGLLCDVEQLMASRCVFCHSDPPVAGAPMPLTSYADLIAAARSVPSKRVAEVALARMQSMTNPMPPAPAAPATPTEIATLKTWIAAGLPMGICGGASGAVDGGANAYGTPTQCTSNMYWTGDNGGSMNPGKACISCHSKGEGPQFTIAGTMYLSAHEPDNCAGSSGGQVVITDANGQTIALAPNSVGNFYYKGPIATPFHAKLVNDGAERVMVAAQTSGDCNSCHTLAGDHGAPGRIMPP
jgi:hypothetical protein